MTEAVVKDGIVEIEGANAVWMDPVAMLSSSYSGYELSHGEYYSRSCSDSRNCPTATAGNDRVSRKRKRKTRYAPNEKELLAELRHQESRLAILSAHSSFLATTYAKISSRISINAHRNSQCTGSMDGSLLITKESDCQVDFLQLAEVWQAPLYELNIFKRPSKIIPGGGPNDEDPLSITHQLFNTVIEHNEDETVAECTEVSFVLPRNCRFLISDVTQLHQLLPAKNQDSLHAGYNLIVIDPPWENRSVHRKSLYPTIPNRQLLSLPIKQLAHKKGALVALWLTNREKLHQFVERELFPAWGVRLSATWYWLKLKSSGEMISPLDMQHHKPYECILLGYLLSDGEEVPSWEQEANRCKVTSMRQKAPPDKFVVMSVPGDHSRKPPMGSILEKYTPGPHPVKGLELFARELNTGWTSWGNEPLHFQNLKYFQHKA